MTLLLSIALPEAARAGTTVDERWTYPATQWSDGTRHGVWRSVYDGYGSVSVVTSNGTKMLREAPRASRTPDETHAGLVTTSTSFGDFDMTVRLDTVKQLRLGSPNPWEVAWVLWHFTDDTHFYYVALKPNGFELGKEDPSYPGAQRYLVTGSARRFPIARWYSVRVRQTGATIRIDVDGARLLTYTDRERPYRTGRAGLYNEDAEVRFSRVLITS